jgi:hypothetical protein
VHPDVPDPELGALAHRFAGDLALLVLARRHGFW